MNIETFFSKNYLIGILNILTGFWLSLAIAHGYLKLPYFFYYYLKIAVCFTSIVVIINAAFENDFKYFDGKSFLLTVIILIFNPIYEIHLGYYIWKIVDFLVSGIFYYIGVKKINNNFPFNFYN
jgi:hypothetical protein